MKKYIFVDIDGTLNDSNKHVSENNIKALQHISTLETEIVFCSGRCNNYLMELIDHCQVGRYIISSNGSMIYDYLEKKILYAKKIPFPIIKKLYTYCINNSLAITFNTEKYRYSSNITNYGKNYSKSDMREIGTITDMKDKCITQFVIGSYEYDKMLEIKKYLDRIEGIEIVNISTTMKNREKNSDSGFFYDVVYTGMNKGSGITKLLEILNISKNDCIAIGDHVNDISMFKAVKYKIAMGNAYDELKKKADYITKSNDEDGVKYALEYIEKELLEK